MIGLYLIVLKPRIHNILVELIGTHIPTVNTGVIQSTHLTPLEPKTWVMDSWHSDLKRIRTVSVPSGVLLIDQLTTINKYLKQTPNGQRRWLLKSQEQ